jgi:hypothetical protein
LTADYDVETSFSRERPESNAGDAGVSQSSEAYLSKNGFKEWSHANGSGKDELCMGGSDMYYRCGRQHLVYRGRRHDP